jgi:hypothetical protein
MRDALMIMIPDGCLPDDVKAKLVASLALSNGRKDSRWAELTANVQDAETVQVMDKADGNAKPCRREHCENRL